MEGLFSAVELDTDTEARAGYRLERLEVYNWGTFHGQVGRLDLHGCNTLLTGDIGSGKSTLVDAVTTLLIPSQRIAYNKAAGADTRERSLRSYVLGHYKSERNETSGTSRPVGLRDHRSFSVLLGVFGNDGYDEQVTLAQVFWMRDTSQGQPLRFYITADRAMSITQDFADFDDLNALRRRLRRGGAEVEDHFPAYGRRARRLLGIESEQAMELFHQTVSMKSVGNLNDFVRQHMLEPADASGWVGKLVGHFEDLTRAHDAVRRARDQLDALNPLLAHCDRHAELASAIAQATARRDALRYFFADHRIGLLRGTRDRLVGEIEEAGADLVRAKADGTGLRQEQERLRIEREGLGGNRIGELERLIETETRLRDARRARAEIHAGHLAAVGLDPATDAETFGRRRAQAEELLFGVRQELAALGNRLTELAVDKRSLDERSRGVNAELVSLRERRNNIPLRNVQVRAALCHALGVDESDLPFAGELIQVKPEDREWQGAAERVLRGFATSILVPNEHYAAVSSWIDDHHLGARIVYYRVMERRVREQVPLTDGGTLFDRLEVRDGAFADWLTQELTHRASHVCATTIDQFRSERRAVTLAGQVKSPDGRHEKDDRHRIDDPSRFVLGWSNEQKIDALLAEAGRLNHSLGAIADESASCVEARATAEDRRSSLEKLSEYRDFGEIDWHASVAAITNMEREKQRLESGDSRLAALTARLEELATEIADTDRRHEEAVDARGRLRNGLADTDERLERQRHVLASRPGRQPGDSSYDEVGAAIAAMLDDDLPREEADCDDAERRLSDHLTTGIDRDRSAQERVAQAAVAAMKDFRRQHPEATTEMDDSILAAGEYNALRERLRTDDLPRFEAEFKKQLNTHTINDLAGFSAWLRRSADQIRERVDIINESLLGIDYNDQRFIRLEAPATPNVEIKEFRAELRACTDDAVAGGSEQYSEERFLRVKRIIERFRGREGQTDADKAWTQRVTDVRNWYTFAASERWRGSEEEYEHYTDSDGKSGGQKEKLAYTILAASLAYQFKLEWGAARSRGFRFAVIDEAFGRGSDVSTRYALGLFRRLGLQLLIVTPLQKVHVIEPFVAGVGFVDNRSGERSRLQTLTIEEYAARKAGLTAATAS